MSNYVKISTIGNREFNVEEQLATEEMVDRMMKHLQQKLSQVLPDQPDLIVLPEFCDIPSNVFLSPAKTHEYCRVRGDKIQRLFSEMASENGCYIAYPTLRLQEDRTWRNSIVVLDRNGEPIGEYAKNHLTLGEIEDYGVVCGTEAPIIACDFGWVACAICFDLNFDRLRLQYVQSKPDLILFPLCIMAESCSLTGLIPADRILSAPSEAACQARCCPRSARCWHPAPAISTSRRHPSIWIARSCISITIWSVCGSSNPNTDQKWPSRIPGIWAPF